MPRSGGERGDGGAVGEEEVEEEDAEGGGEDVGDGVVAAEGASDGHVGGESEAVVVVVGCSARHCVLILACVLADGGDGDGGDSEGGGDSNDSTSLLKSRWGQECLIYTHLFPDDDADRHVPLHVLFLLQQFTSMPR